MIGDLVFRAGLALLRKSAMFGFDLQNGSEQMRKYMAIYPNLARSIGYSEPSWTGKSVSEATALNISTWWTCVSQISKACAILPLHLMQDTDSGKAVASTHPLDWCLYREPNPDMSALVARRDMTAHVLTWGNAYALKVKRGGTTQTIGLWPWTPDSVRHDRTREGARVYIHREGNSAEKTYEPADVFHLPGFGFDGLRGYSVVHMARQSLGLASIQDEYASKFFAGGGKKPYYLQKKTNFRDDQTYDKFRAKWEAVNSGPASFHRAPILEGDIELHELGMPLEDAQLLASRQFSVADICRWFDMTPHMAGDLSHATFSNVEHLGLDAVKRTFMYWFCLWEQEIDRQLLTDGEKGRYYAKFNVSALERGDFQSRMQGYSIGLQNGFMNPDKVCGLEDWDPLPNKAGEAYHIQLNMQTLPGTGEPTTAERAALAKISLQQQDGGQNNASGN